MRDKTHSPFMVCGGFTTHVTRLYYTYIIRRRVQRSKRFSCDTFVPSKFQDQGSHAGGGTHHRGSTTIDFTAASSPIPSHIHTLNLSRVLAVRCTRFPRRHSCLSTAPYLKMASSLLSLLLPFSLLYGHVAARNPVDKYVEHPDAILSFSRSPALPFSRSPVLPPVNSPAHSPHIVHASFAAGGAAATTEEADLGERFPSRAPTPASSFP